MCRSIIRLGGDPHELPLTYMGGEFVCKREFENRIRGQDTLVLPLRSNYDDNFKPLVTQELRTEYFVRQLRPNVVVACIEDTPDSLFPNRGDALDFRRSTDSKVTKERLSETAWEEALGSIEDIVTQIWGEPPQIEISGAKIFADIKHGDDTVNWGLILRRSKAE